MAWWLAFSAIALVGFLFDGDIARHVPYTELVIRQTMIGSIIGLATGYAIHSFERLR